MPADPDNPVPRAASGGRWRGYAAGAMVLAVFGAVVALVSLELRAGWRAQVLQREGDVLQAVASMQQSVVADLDEQALVPSLDPALEVALHTSKMRGVLAVRIYDLFGGFRDAVPAEVDEGALRPADLEVLAAGRPVVRYHAAFRLDELLLDREAGEPRAMLEVNVPLAKLPGSDVDAVIIQYWIEGSAVEAEFAQLDAHVARQAGIAFLAGASLIAGSLLWAFRRLNRANRQLWG